MSVVTDEEYKRSKEFVDICSTSLSKSHERIMELIDELAAERTSYETYKRAIEFNKEIIMKYEMERD